MSYTPDPDRYQTMEYRRCGRSGLKLPAISLGLWHNFGASDDLARCRDIVRTAFDAGIVHFDLANNYGPPPGSAETTFATILKWDLAAHRDEISISTKAGYRMWEGPYGDGGSRKYLVASLDQSLKRLGVDYVDIFYHHRPDPLTPMEETMDTLVNLVKQGKALYIGLSSYSPKQTKKAQKILKSMGATAIIHQVKYSMLVRDPEEELFSTLEKEGMGCIAFSSLAQGILTGKYGNGIPADSRAASGRGNGAIEEKTLQQETLRKVEALSLIAQSRNQSMAQLALLWTLRHPQMTSLILGASRSEQVKEAVQILDSPPLEKETLAQIDAVLQ